MVYESQLPGGWVGGKYQKSETQMADGGVTLIPKVSIITCSVTRQVPCDLQKDVITENCMGGVTMTLKASIITYISSRDMSCVNFKNISKNL